MCRHETQVVLLQGLVVLAGQGIDLVPGVRMVELAVRVPEDLLKACVVSHHCQGMGLAPREGLESVNVFHRAEGLLVHPQLSCVPQLLEACGEVQVESLRARDVRPVPLVLETVEVGQMQPDEIAEPAELGTALVSHAEIICTVRGGRVERLEL